MVRSHLTLALLFQTMELVLDEANFEAFITPIYRP